MSDIKLFKIAGGQVDELVGTTDTIEKSVQTLFERNLEAFLGVRFLASEFTTTNGGAAVTTLTPTVSLTKVDGTTDAQVNETTVDAVATNGQQMRWSDTQYVYNLSTKLSQQTGNALTAGTYKVTVSDSSFTAPVSAQVDLKK